MQPELPVWVIRGPNWHVEVCLPMWALRFDHRRRAYEAATMAMATYYNCVGGSDHFLVMDTTDDHPTMDTTLFAHPKGAEDKAGEWVTFDTHKVLANHGLHGPAARMQVKYDEEVQVYRVAFEDSKRRAILNNLKKSRPIEIGKDGLCMCSCADPCPLHNKAGTQMRCSETELQLAGIPTIRL